MADFRNLGFIDRAERFAHNKELGGGIPGHLLGYGVMAPLSYPLGYAFDLVEKYDRQVPRRIEQPVKAPAQIKMPPKKKIVRRRRAVTRKIKKKAVSMVQAAYKGSKGRGVGWLVPSRVLQKGGRSLRSIGMRNRQSLALSSYSGKRLVKSVIAPPTNYQGSYSTGTYCRLFHRGKDNVMDFRCRVGTVTLKYADLANTPTVNIYLQGGNNAKGSYFLGGNSRYIPEPAYDVLILFNEMKYEKACFEFTPRVTGGTSTGFALTWGFSPDPNYPQAHAFTFVSSGADGYVAFESQIGSMDGSTQFPAWTPSACYDATSKLDKQWRYVNGPDYLSLFNPADSAADQRQTYAGVLMIAGDENYRTDTDGDLEIVLGTLYLKGQVAMRSFTTEATSGVTAARGYRCLERLARDPEHRERVLKALLNPRKQEEKHFAPQSDKVLSVVRSKPVEHKVQLDEEEEEPLPRSGSSTRSGSKTRAS